MVTSSRIRVALLALLSGVLTPGAAYSASDAGSGSGLQLPRFVSLKSDKVNVRGGPNKDQDVAWVYTRTGLPVEITAEFENWRRIRDWEGAEGWVYHSLLSGRRTGLISAAVKGKSPDQPVPIHASADAKSAVVAQLEPGVLGAVKRCDGQWCRVSGKGINGTGFDGWIEQDRLWGVYPNEKVE